MQVVGSDLDRRRPAVVDCRVQGIDDVVGPVLSRRPVDHEPVAVGGRPCDRIGGEIETPAIRRCLPERDMAVVGQVDQAERADVPPEHGERGRHLDAGSSEPFDRAADRRALDDRRRNRIVELGQAFRERPKGTGECGQGARAHVGALGRCRGKPPVSRVDDGIGHVEILVSFGVNVRALFRTRS